MRLLLAIIMSLYVSTADADLLSDAWGIATDPLKLESASENSISAIIEARSAVLTAIGALSELRSEVDIDIRYYLADIDAKIDAIDEMGVAFISEITSLETKIISDLLRVIQAAECSVFRVGEYTIGDQVFDRLPVFVADNEVTYRMPFGTKTSTVLWFIPWGQEPDFLVVPKNKGLSAFDEFRMIERAYLESLAKAPEDADAVLIPATYANLAILAARTACLYEGTHFEKMFLSRKFAEYNAKIVPWGRPVRVDF